MSLLLRFYLVGLVLVGGLLVWALARGGQETIRRTVTLVVLLHLICLALWLGPVAFGILAALILLFSWRELGGGPPVLAAYGLWFAAVLASRPLAAAAAPLGVGAGLAALWAGPALTARGAFGVAFGLCLAATGAAALVHLAWPDPAPLLALLLLVQMNDACAYFAGKRFGRTRLFPATSPNKSLEGYAAGALALAGGIVLLHSPLLPLLARAGLGADLGVFAFVFLLANLGDLSLSAVKRGRGVKDFGALLPGHGGVLDRFGNILMAAPLFAVLWRAVGR
jgi:phosphatidate cytidylyltransferase